MTDFPLLDLVLVFFTGVYFLEAWLDLRQYAKNKTTVKPAALNEVQPPITQEKFEKAQHYSRDKKVYGMCKQFYDLVESFVLLKLFLLPRLWGWAILTVGDMAGEARQGFWDEVAVSLTFMFTYTFITSIIGQPWSLWYTFVLEEKHGFNKQTLKLYVMDWVKGQALGIVIGSPIMAILIWIVRNCGEHFYFYAWAAVAVIQIIMLTLYPVLIAPLFNDFAPLVEGPLRDKIEKLAASIDFPLTKLYTIDGSKRSSHSNAYMYGFWWNKRIVLYDTLIEQTKHDEEVVAVIGHELGHWKLNHTSWNLLISQVLLFTTFFTYGLVMNSKAMYHNFGFNEAYGQPVMIGLMIFSMLNSPIDHVIGFCMNYLSRRFEYQADGFALGLGYGDELCRGLVAIATENLGDMNPDEYYSMYHHSHPTLLERLQAIRAADQGDQKKGQ